VTSRIDYCNVVFVGAAKSVTGILQRCQEGTAAQYLAVHWSSVSETASRQHLRSVARHQLTVPPHRRTTYGGRAFAVAGPSMWNSLPKRLRDPSFSTAVFGRLLKTFLRVLVYLSHWRLWRYDTIDMGRKLGAVPLLGDGELGSRLVQCGLDGLDGGPPPCQVSF